MQPADSKKSLIPERRRMKCVRGKPVLYSELKQPRSLALTDTAMRSAKEFGMLCGTTSISASVETALRLTSQLKLYFPPEELKQIIQGIPSNQVTEEVENVLEKGSQ